MLNYFIKKLEEEYHHLSLWYFVFFFYGIAFYFKSIDFLCEINLFNNIFLISIICLILLSSIVFFLRKREKILLTFFISILLAFFCGVSIASFRFINIVNHPISEMGIFDIEAMITEIKPTINGSQLLLTNIKILEKEKSRVKKEALNKIRVNLKGANNDNFYKEDIIKLRVRLFPIRGSLIPGGYDFGIYMYLDNIQATGYILGSPQLIKRDIGTNLSYYYKKIQNIRNIIYQNLIKVLGSYEGNFVAAILIGETKALDPVMATNMRNSGVAHILSVSGLHLSLIAMIFFIFARFLLNCSNYISYTINVKAAAGFISILGSFGYLLLSGSNIAATRAFIMTLIFTLAIIFERSPYPLRSVMLAAMLILLFSPEYVMHPSFQLSFSAVLCLISGYEIYVRHQQFFGNSKGLFNSIKLYVISNIYSSFLGSIVTAPFVIYHFYKFATYSILMNLIAVPLMSFFMMPLAIISLFLMPFNFSEYSVKLIGFFVRIVTDSAQYIVDLPNSIFTTGYITDSSMFTFTLGFFWSCLWQTAWRYFGMLIIALSVIMMYFSPKPDLIYDHRIRAISIKNNDTLDIYSQNRISSFMKEYLSNWYGLNKSKNFIRNISHQDHLFELSDSLTYNHNLNNNYKNVSLNYTYCSEADIQIITSSKLSCKSNKIVVPYNSLVNSGIVLVFCDQNNCHVKLGERSFWKTINQ